MKSEKTPAVWFRKAIRKIHHKTMTCENCGHDKICGLPINCGHKEDFKRISHLQENKIYCSLWCEKEKSQKK